MSSYATHPFYSCKLLACRQICKHRIFSQASSQDPPILAQRDTATSVERLDRLQRLEGALHDCAMRHCGEGTSRLVDVWEKVAEHDGPVLCSDASCPSKTWTKFRGYDEKVRRLKLPYSDRGARLSIDPRRPRASRRAARASRKSFSLQLFPLPFSPSPQSLQIFRMEVLLGITGKDFTLIAASKAAMRGVTILKATDDKTRELNKYNLMAFSGEAGDTGKPRPLSTLAKSSRSGHGLTIPNPRQCNSQSTSKQTPSFTPCATAATWVPQR